MKNNIQQLVVYKKELFAKISLWIDHAILLLDKYWLKGIFIVLGIWLMISKDISININMQNAMKVASTMNASGDKENKVKPMNTSLLKKAKTKVQGDDNLANTYSNLTKGGDLDAQKAEKRRKQLVYVKKYKHIAIKEMNEYGIPASITLAQGLLESNVGESKLATRNNNHFGMKCFSKKCKKGHCSNFTDDSHKDFFRIYANAEDSYRAHSLLLKKSTRYRKLFNLSKHDYKGWAKGLKSAGYATDPKYAYKIIGIIEDLDLNKYDN